MQCMRACGAWSLVIPAWCATATTLEIYISYLPDTSKRPSFTRPPLAKAMLLHQYRRQLAEALGEAGTADAACDLP